MIKYSIRVRPRTSCSGNGRSAVDTWIFQRGTARATVDVVPISPTLVHRFSYDLLQLLNQRLLSSPAAIFTSPFKSNASIGQIQTFEENAIKVLRLDWPGQLQLWLVILLKLCQASKLFKDWQGE